MFSIENKTFYFYKSYRYEYYTNISYTEYNKLHDIKYKTYYYITNKKKDNEELLEKLNIIIEKISDNCIINNDNAFINFNILEVNNNYYKIDIDNIEYDNIIFKKYLAISDNIYIFYKYLNKKLYPNIDLYGSDSIPSLCKIMSELNGIKKTKLIDYIVNSFCTDYYTYLSISDIIETIPTENPKLMFKATLIDKDKYNNKNAIFVLYDTYLNDIYFKESDNLNESIDKLLCMRNFLNYYIFDKKNRFIYIDINTLYFVKADNIKFKLYDCFVPNTLFIKALNNENNYNETTSKSKNNKINKINKFYIEPSASKYRIKFYKNNINVKWIKDKYNNYYALPEFIMNLFGKEKVYEKYLKKSNIIYCNSIKISIDENDAKEKKNIEEYIKCINIEYYKKIESYYIVLIISGIINGTLNPVI